MPKRGKLLHRDGRSSKLLRQPELEAAVVNARREAFERAEVRRVEREQQARDEASRRSLDLSKRPTETARYFDGERLMEFEVVWNGR